MKKIFLFAFVIALLQISCSTADLDSEVTSLKERLAKLENSKSVIAVTFQGTKMVITYSTNETTTLDMPSGLNGLNGTPGTNGVNGTGINTISYNETTGILTITLTNGNVSEFKVVNNGSSGMTAVLISDVNGKMYVSAVTLGAIPIATIGYDNDFNMTSLLSKIVEDGRILDNFRIDKEYTNGKLSNLKTVTYATSKKVAYIEEYIEIKDTVRATNIGDYYKLNINDGTYRYYEYNYSDVEGHHYAIYPFAMKRNYQSDYEYYVKVNENLVYWFSYFKQTSTVINGVPTYTYWFNLSTKYTKTGFLNIGDIETTENNQIENNSNGNPEKIYYEDDSYIQLYYNSSALVVKAEKYSKVGSGWTINDGYMTFEYNSKNLLTSGTMNYSADAPEEIFKTVYDSNGNPVEIYWEEGEATGNYFYFDPFTNPNDPWASGNDEVEGLQLVAKIEYDYGYKNFFGNSISALIPELNNYKIFNAPVKISHTQSWAYATMKYENFSSEGYPASLLLNIYDGDSEGYSLEFSVDYIKKE